MSSISERYSNKIATSDKNVLGSVCVLTYITAKCLRILTFILSFKSAKQENKENKSKLKGKRKTKNKIIRKNDPAIHNFQSEGKTYVGRPLLVYSEY